MEYKTISTKISNKQHIISVWSITNYSSLVGSLGPLGWYSLLVVMFVYVCVCLCVALFVFFCKHLISPIYKGSKSNRPIARRFLGTQFHIEGGGLVQSLTKLIRTFSKKGYKKSNRKSNPLFLDIFREKGQRTKKHYFFFKDLKYLIFIFIFFMIFSGYYFG